MTGAHASRWGGERVAAGVKRARGGAIVVTVDATEIAALEKPASLESLLEEITAGSPEIAYTVFEHADGRIAFGDVPAGRPGRPGRAVAHRERPAGARVRERRAARRGRDRRACASGMRLDNVRRVEQRMLCRLVASVAAAAALVALAFGLAGLRRRYGVAQREARARGGGAAPSRPPRRDGRARLDRGPRGPQPAERRRHDGPAPEARVPGRVAGGRRRAGGARGAALGHDVRDAADRPDRAAVPRVRAAAAARAGARRPRRARAATSPSGRARSPRPAASRLEVEASGGGHRRRRSRAAAAGPRQPRPQRGRGDARGRAGLPRRAPRGRGARGRGARHRPRDRARPPAADLRPLLHDEGGRHRRRPRRHAADRDRPRRDDRGGLAARARARP